MSLSAGRIARSVVGFIAGVLVFTGAAVLMGYAQGAKKATTAPAANAAAGSAVARGQYLVEDVAMCGTCHTPRHSNGTLDRSQWLAGAPVPYQPSQPTTDWPALAPRIAGLPPASNDGMVTLLTTGVWITGKQLREPMPKFHMTKADAESVVAYLKSVKTSK
jgi:mono/diheme cytochrome c family protein